MEDWMPAVVVILCMTPVFAYWVKLFRSRRLRVRVMAVSSALGMFSGFLVIGFWYWLFLSIPLTLESLAMAFTASILLGSTFLMWWPLFKKSLTELGIGW